MSLICSMAVSKINVKRKHSHIRKRYNEMKAIQDKGVQKFTSAYIIRLLADEFYLQAVTIENIVWTKE